MTYMWRIIVVPGGYNWWTWYDKRNIFLPSNRNLVNKNTNPYGEWLWVGRAYE